MLQSRDRPWWHNLSWARNVVIGGPLVIGPYARFTRACHQAAKGREGAEWVADKETGRLSEFTKYDHNPYKQGWGNCGPECARMLINAMSDREKPLTEWEMLDWALKNSRAEWGSQEDPEDSNRPAIVIPRGEPSATVKDEQLHRFDADGRNVPPGGSNPSDWKAMTEAHGVHTEDLPPKYGDESVDQTVARSLREGKPVIYSTHPGWLTGKDPGGYHIVLVTGYEPGPNGEPVAFYVNDPASGCSIRVSAEHLKKEQRKGYGLVRPSEAAW